MAAMPSRKAWTTWALGRTPPEAMGNSGKQCAWSCPSLGKKPLRKAKYLVRKWKGHSGANGASRHSRDNRVCERCLGP